MSETKVSKVIKSFQDNDLASSILKAIIENDEQLYLNALYYADLDDEDLTLSDAEFDNLLKGVKPSGELDITTWEGYYEANVGSNLDDPLVFLILSMTESVYWGTRSQIMSQPENHVVDYTLTSDGKINFHTPSDGDVSMTLTRTFDDTTGDLNVKFSAVCSGQIVFGVKVIPPLHLALDARTLINSSTGGRTLTIRTPLSLLIIKINHSAHGKDRSSKSSLTWQDICTIVGTGITLITFFGFFYQLFRWQKEASARRAERSQRIQRQLEEGSVEGIELLAEYRAKPLDVNFDSAGRKLTDAVTSVINGRINIGAVDLRQDPEGIIRDLRGTARTMGEETLYDFVKSYIGSHIYEMLDPYRSLRSYLEFRDAALNKSIRDKVDPKLRDLGTEVYDLLIRSVILPARQRVFADDYKELEEVYKGKELAYNEAVRTRQNTEGEIELVQKKIDDAKTDVEREEHEKRREELLEELEAQKAHERESIQAQEKARQEKDRAAEDSREADRHVKDDTSKADWEKKLENVFKK